MNRTKKEKKEKRPVPVRPQPLRAGDRAALVAPSFYTSEQKLQDAVHSLKMLGLHPVIYPSCTHRFDYLAGKDEERAQDLMKAFADPDIRAIFCLRGGYGAARILDLLDYGMISKNPKIFVGFSDITALHTVFQQKCGMITYHGPMPTAPYHHLDEKYSLSSLRAALFGKKEEYEIRIKGLQVLCGGNRRTSPVIMKGILCGGNLTVLASALGTPYEIETAGKILFLEDVGEKTYRIDRAFSSLGLAGKLGDCSGILLGTFEGCRPQAGGRSCEEIIRQIAEPLGIPVVCGMPSGHSRPNMTLPLGAPCEITENGGIRFTF